MVTLSTQRDFRAVQNMPFCYVCARLTLAHGDAGASGGGGKGVHYPGNARLIGSWRRYALGYGADARKSSSFRR